MECRICKKTTDGPQPEQGWQSLEISLRIGDKVMQGTAYICPECTVLYNKALEVPENTVSEDMLTAIQVRLWGILGCPQQEEEESGSGTEQNPGTDTQAPSEENKEKEEPEKETEVKTEGD